jgi:hypothetical protein
MKMELYTFAQIADDSKVKEEVMADILKEYSLRDQAAWMNVLDRENLYMSPLDLIKKVQQ